MPANIKITVGPHTFTIAPRFAEGHVLSTAEATVLNRLVAKRLREAIISGRVTTRSEAEAFVNSPSIFAEAVEDDFAGLSDFDEESSAQ